MLLVYTVEKNGFRQMMEVIDSRYDLPGCKQFTQIAIPQLYSRIRDSVASELKNVDYFAATTDLWSNHTTEPYISLTVHFIN